MQIMHRLVLVHGSTLRKEKKRPEKSYGLLGLRCGPVATGNNPLYPGHFPLSYSDRLLSSLRSGKEFWQLPFFPITMCHSSADWEQL